MFVLSFILDSSGIVHEVLDTDSEIVPLCALSVYEWPLEWTFSEFTSHPRTTCINCLHLVIEWQQQELNQLRAELNPSLQFQDSSSDF